MAVTRHLGHVGPGGMAGECEEIEMLAGHIVEAFKRALAVPDSVVIMQVSPIELLAIIRIRTM